MKISTFKKIFRGFVTVAIAFIAVSTIAFAQTTFTKPSSNAPGGNVASPVIQSAKFQQMAGGISAPSVGSENGFVLQGSGNTTSTWGLQYSSTQIDTDLLTTLNVQQFCLGTGSGNCISSLGSIVPSADIYLNSASCSGGSCITNAATALKICQNNGYTHVANAIGGGNGNNYSCYWNGSAWSCSSGCSSSCGAAALQRVSCDDNQ